ncbi:MAG TPA: MauE/DoxX family redox-associated membrane protein [Actinomycetota bacterium]|nr:MauE/DoxX family redox-associated membrane protein [Actinomycetota bacterium]
MAETITPVVHGGRRRAWAVSLAAHVLGAAIAAAVFGAVLGAFGALLGAPWGTAGMMTLTAAAAVYLIAELGARVPVPQLRRQVPDWWRTFFPPRAAAFLYGIGLGPGFLTYLTHGTLVVVAVAAAATGSPLLGAAIVMPFGIARGLTVLVAFDVRTPAEGALLVDRLSRSSSRVGWRLANVIALGAVLVLALVRSASIDEPGEAEAVAAAALMVTFGASAIAKFSGWSTWRRALRSYGLPEPLERLSAFAVPSAEVLVALLPLLGLRSSAGLLALALLSAFSVAIVAARARGDRRIDCGCFGAARRRDYRVLLLRNGVLAVVAAVAWETGEDAWALGSLGVPRGSELIPAAITIVGLALAAWVAAQAVRALGRRGDA